MTYHNFLEFVFTPISYFVNWLQMVANSLMNNYFFITILGVVLFVSLFWLLFDTFKHFINRHISKYEDYNDKYNDYATYQQIQKEYYNRHRLDIYEFKYDKYAMSQQIIIDFFQRNQRLLFDYKLQNLKLNKQVILSYLLSNKDYEYLIDSTNLKIKREVAHDYLYNNHDDEVNYRVLNKRINEDANTLYYNGDEPSWLNNKIDKTDLTDKEQKEFDDLIKYF